MAAKVYVNRYCPYAQRVRIALREKALLEEKVYIEIEVDFDNKPKELLNANHNGKVPTLIDGDFSLYESLTICEYLEEKHPDPPLLTGGVEERARIRLRATEADQYVVGPIGTLYHKEAGEEGVQEAVKEIREQIDRLEEKLVDFTFICGERFTLADIVWGPVFQRLDDILSKHHQTIPLAPRTSAYRDRLLAHKSIKETAPPKE